MKSKLSLVVYVKITFTNEKKTVFYFFFAPNLNKVVNFSLEMNESFESDKNLI